MREELAQLNKQSNFVLDYAEVIDEQTFDRATDETEKKRAIVAGWIEGIRLIDTMAMAKKLVQV